MRIVEKAYIERSDHQVNDHQNRFNLPNVLTQSVNNLVLFFLGEGESTIARDSDGALRRYTKIDGKLHIENTTIEEET